MSYELRAIIEYDAARLEIKECGVLIADSMAKPCLNPIKEESIESQSDEPNLISCIDDFYQYNRNCRIADEVGESLDGGMGLTPDLCDRCKELDARIQDRKQAKQRFGIAKTRLSRIARDYRNSFVIEVQS